MVLQNMSKPARGGGNRRTHCDEMMEEIHFNIATGSSSGAVVFGPQVVQEGLSRPSRPHRYMVMRSEREMVPLTLMYSASGLCSP